jgi:hypothetical protein
MCRVMTRAINVSFQYVYINTKPSYSQQYMFIIVYRLETEQLVSAAFGHHQAQIQKLIALFLIYI